MKFFKRSALSNLSNLRVQAPQVINPRLPNVLKHFLVGVTLDGLTERQLIQRVQVMGGVKSPRKPRSGRLHRRKSLTDTRDGYQVQPSGIARASSDQLCRVSSSFNLTCVLA